MNMFKKVKADSVTSYLASVPKEHKADVLFLYKFIQKVAPKLKPRFAYNMLGYGSFPYRNYKNELLEWPTVALANQKNYISLYVCAVEKGKYIAEKHKKDLGEVKVGKSCISFKKVADLNLVTLKKVLLLSQKNPGLPGIDAR